MPSSLKHPSRIPMWRGTKAAYLLVAFCTFPIAIGGFWSYGNQASKTEEKPFFNFTTSINSLIRTLITHRYRQAESSKPSTNSTAATFLTWCSA